MTPQAWLTLAVLVLMFIALLKEVLGPDIIMFTALTVLWAAGVISTAEATAGFSNPQVLTVALLFVVAAAVQATGALRALQRVILGRPAHPALTLARLTVPIAALSAFLNNTPLVAMFIPSIRDWAQRHKQPPSRLLIPLSYAAILGGTCTLIGTSTNLVVSGLLEANDHPPFALFELSPVGLPVAAVGLAFLALLGPRLLPDRQAPALDSQDTREQRDYAFTARVLPTCPLRDKTIEDAGLRHLDGLFLVEIRRGARRLVPVRPTDLVREGDSLIFYGRPDTAAALLATPGLTADDIHDDYDHPPSHQHLAEIVVRESAPLVGTTLRDFNFRRKYDAAVIGIFRDGERLREKLGDVTLRPWDTLLVLAADGFTSTWRDSPDFYLLADADEPPTRLTPHTALALLTLTLMIGAIAAQLLPTLLAAAIAAATLTLTRAIQPAQARKSVDLSVILVIASSFGISAAVRTSGLADHAAALVQHLAQGAPPLLALALIYLLCTVVTELLSNAAAAALVFPIALSTAERLHLDPRPFALAIAISASLAFVTPIGYQTNLLVYGPGGYRFTDFTRIGAPLALLTGATTLLTLAWLYDLG